MTNSRLIRDTDGAVDKEEDHGAEGPGGAEDADAAVRVQLTDACVCVVVPDDYGHRPIVT